MSETSFDLSADKELGAKLNVGRAENTNGGDATLGRCVSKMS